MADGLPNYVESLFNAVKRSPTDAPLRLLTLKESSKCNSAEELLSSLVELKALEKLYVCEAESPQQSVMVTVLTVEVLTARADGEDSPGVSPQLPSERVSAARAFQLMQEGKVDALVIVSKAVEAQGNASAETGALALAIFAKHFEIPCLILAAASALGVQDKSENTPTAHDVISASLIHGILTEKGVLYPENSQFDVASFAKYGVNGADQFAAFKPLSEQLTIDYLKSRPSLAEKVGPVEAPGTCREAGDGNINYVYIVEGPNGGLVVKQGLPYIRVVGESWQLTQV